MADSNTVAREPGEMVKTTVEFRSDLWERAAAMAVRLKTTRQKLADEGLEMRLAQLDSEQAAR